MRRKKSELLISLFSTADLTSGTQSEVLSVWVHVGFTNERILFLKEAHALGRSASLGVSEWGFSFLLG